MTAVPVVRVWTSGEIVTAANMISFINGPISFLLARPILQCRQTVAQTFTTATGAAVTFDSEDVDSSGMHSTVSNTSRFTAVFPGWYDDDGSISWAANANGRRLAQWKLNATTLVSGGGMDLPTTAASVAKAPAASILTFLNVGDFLELFGTQESGGNLATTVTGGQEQPHAKLVWASN